jgi:hypothetical protein
MTRLGDHIARVQTDTARFGPCESDLAKIPLVFWQCGISVRRIGREGGSYVSNRLVPERWGAAPIGRLARAT